MPPEAVADNRNRYAVVWKTFSELLEHVHYWRASLAGQAQQANVGQFTSSTLIDTDRTTRRFYALGVYGGNKDHTLLFADIPLSLNGEESENAAEFGSTSTSRHSGGDLRCVEWKPLLRVNQESWLHRGMLTKEEELMRERMRCMTQGITSYDFHAHSGNFLFAANGHLYRCADDQQNAPVCPSPVDVPLNISAPLDPKICPANANLVSCVCRNDIYIQFGPTARQATFSREEDDSNAKLCGVPSFIVQEEFDRYTGYWWRPIAGGVFEFRKTMFFKFRIFIENDTYYMLFEETDENGVLELSINVPATRAEHVELMRYPRTGTNNPTWTLKMLKIRLLDTSDENSDPVKDAKIEEYQFGVNLREIFPWAEYLVRAGWTPDGQGVWFQLMSRIQDHLVLVYAPLEAFHAQSAHQRGYQYDTSMEDLTRTDHERTLRSSNVVVLYEEHTPECWLNYHDAVHFLKTNDDEFEFLWISGKSGFYHLYLVTSSANAGHTPAVHREIQLTSGDWDVRRRCQLHVDQDRKLVYFAALKESPLESHVYVTSYQHPGPIRLLTETGYTYGNQRDNKTFCISGDGRLMISSRSSITQVGECVVYSLNYDNPGGYRLPESSLLYKLNKATVSRPLASGQEAGGAGSENPDLPVLFTHDSKRTGFRHYAYLFKPCHFKAGFKYPTILYIYAGPEVQLVKNVWMGSYGFQKYTSLGYAVVIADGRGSANRGVQFEMALKRGLGTLEIDDQVEMLTEVANRSGLIDMERVALLGWSYGGYMSLLGLAQRPDVFKVAVAGAPVTVWSLYDTAYTERYMGLPQFNQEAYLRSSVLSYIDRFPSESGRLLLLHGLIDENVHFRHTSTLVSALLRAGKPYQLQVFPTDRHAVRNSEVTEHMDATVLDFLQRNLSL